MTKSNDVTNVEIVVYALAILRGAERSVHTEDIAAKCYELAPSSFSWRLAPYRDKGWPDKYIVKTALEDAKKEDRALVEGAYALDVAKDGWRLTPKGARWFGHDAKRIENTLDLQPSKSLISKLERQRFLKQLRSQPLYKEFSKNGALHDSTKYNFTDMLNCSPDASKEVIALKFNRLRSTAELVGDQDINLFLEVCSEAFSDLLKDVGQGDIGMRNNNED
jgi:hypothetical protein